MLTESTPLLVLNTCSDIPAKNRESIRTVADEMGYKPNSNARLPAMRNPGSVKYFGSWQLGQLSDDPPFRQEK